MPAPDELPVKVYSPESSATHPAQLLGELFRDVLTGFPADHLAPFLLVNARWCWCCWWWAWCSAWRYRC
jgi:hypothetical protein